MRSNDVAVTGASSSLSTWTRALRVHQWSKNLLLFVPLLTAFQFFRLERVASAVIAFGAFSLAASGGYLLNDLHDLESDRAHPTKRNRPLASGTVSTGPALAAAALAVIGATTMALLLPRPFLVILLAYLLLTTGYTWILKQYVVMDVIVLSLLYTIRIFAGSAAVAVRTSPWLLALSVFVFLSLALIKRCSELVLVDGRGDASSRGRDYRVTDLNVLWPFGVGSAVSAVVVFGLFINAPETRAQYATPQLLWLVAIGLMYWLARLWLKTSRGEMHDDPVVYALTDLGSLVTIAGMVAAAVVAHFVSVG